ncbi:MULTISPECIES: TrbG/VirB9 family P-type conjugative transfer protein [unclassified Luteimonas]|uniref:TrbG/VirB9 family P-type conjugative transfer protein n=1 Tax=unclassified Luteimonas TaxID=2629088 RepID=UPI0016034921|nr:MULTISPECIES: TrbG/VirB9 family P-type conjugative transfer protein [unclassified Luteimonas]MBB1471443.1 TrbG/VirB9 family P-type conjugative transfer protein [Luteimonas sp. MC1782]MBB6599818.1 TrbG/VirB9 family P-type conjugative transfer protein [Luteimonas sp. MC1825]QOC89562.1 TrbG/VirB9 family P-type conjugative transfer protein [Luteimonas sp. MC1825]
MSLACWLVAGPVHAQQVDVYEYEPDQVYPVHTALGIATQIELDPAEEILDYSTGFSSGWDLTRRGTVFYLRPRDADVDTNMLVRTQSHAYIFELKVVASDWTSLEQARRAGVQYKIAFRYPPDESFKAPAEESPTAGLSITLDRTRQYNYDYDYAVRRGQAWLVPANVYDDGSFTYVRMGDQARLPTGGFPVVFGREREDGEDFVVNTTVEGSTVVVHGTYPYLVVRHGRNVVGLRRNPR